MKPCNLQNLPREKTPEAAAILKAYREWLFTMGGTVGNYNPHPPWPHKPNLQVRAAVRQALGLE